MTGSARRKPDTSLSILITRPRQAWPTLPVAGGFFPEQAWPWVQLVHVQQIVLQVIQAMGAVQRARAHINPKAGRADQVAVDAIRDLEQWRISTAEFPLVPEVDAGLVAHFHVDAQVRAGLLHPGDYPVLCLPGHIGVKVGDVIVLDAPAGRQPCAVVPEGLEQAPATSMQWGYPALPAPPGVPGLPGSRG